MAFSSGDSSNATLNYKRDFEEALNVSWQAEAKRVAGRANRQDKETAVSWKPEEGSVEGRDNRQDNETAVSWKPEEGSVEGRDNRQDNETADTDENYWVAHFAKKYKNSATQMYSDDEPGKRSKQIVVEYATKNSQTDLTVQEMEDSRILRKNLRLQKMNNDRERESRKASHKFQEHIGRILEKDPTQAKRLACLIKCRHCRKAYQVPSLFQLAQRSGDVKKEENTVDAQEAVLPGKNLSPKKTTIDYSRKDEHAESKSKTSVSSPRKNITAAAEEAVLPDQKSLKKSNMKSTRNENTPEKKTKTPESSPKKFRPRSVSERPKRKRKSLRRLLLERAAFQRAAASHLDPKLLAVQQSLRNYE